MAVQTLCPARSRRRVEEFSIKWGKFTLKVRTFMLVSSYRFTRTTRIRVLSSDLCNPRLVCDWAYLSVTALVAEPPALLRTVMFFGSVGHDNWALKRPPPLFFKLTIKVPVDVT